MNRDAGTMITISGCRIHVRMRDAVCKIPIVEPVSLLTAIAQ